MIINNKTRAAMIWVGTRAIDMVPFDRIIPIQAIMTCDYGSDVKDLERSKQVFSLEKQIGERHIWTNFHLNYIFRDNLSSSLINYLSKIQGDIQFLCYSASGSLDQLISKKIISARNLTIPVQSRIFFDDKILLHFRLNWLGIKTLPTLVVQLGNLSYEALANTLGKIIVIKLPVGSAGVRTYYVDNKESLEIVQLQHCSATALVQTFLPGIPICIHGVVNSENILLSPPSLQIIGSQTCTENRFEWCGNDFDLRDHIPTKLVEDAWRKTTLIGQYLMEYGYKGIFGVDLLIDTAGQVVYILEINPRFQGSTPLLTQLELINNAPSFLLEHHLRAFGSQAVSRALALKILDSFQTCGSQVILHNKSSRPVVITNNVPAGIYSWDKTKDTFTRARNGLSLLDCNSADEYVLSGGVPLKGQLIMPGAPLLWIQTLKNTLKDPAVGELTKEMQSVCEYVYSMFGLKEYYVNPKN